MKVHRASRYGFALALLALPIVAQAQGFGLNEVGTCALSRGYAGTGAPCSDASVIYWNPGAATMLNGGSVLLGLSSIAVNGSFTRDTTFRKYEADVPTAYVPDLFLNYHNPTSHWAFGVGAYVPYGLTSQWSDSFPGRFSAVKAAIQTVYIQPNLGFKLNDRWSFGIGPVYGHSHVELTQALDLGTTPTPVGPTFGQLGIPRRTEFGRAKLDGSASAWGVSAGAMGKLGTSWTVGARFLSSLVFSYDNADATFSQTNTGIVLPQGNPIGAGGAPVGLDTVLAHQFTSGGALVSQKVATRIAHPAQIEVGLGYNGFQGWLLAADYVWIGWKQFTDLPVTFQGPAAANSRVLIEKYNNTSGIRVGAERQFSGGAAIRFGASGAASAAPAETVTPLLPEQDRSMLTLGGTLPLFGKVSLDGGYSHVFAPGRRGRIDERTSLSQTADQLNSGVYQLSANIFSLSLKASF